MIDLHSHSHYSDGALHPRDLVAKALKNGLRLMALTDHDTVAGLPEFHQAAENTALKVINGIELSTRWKKYDIHILGLNIDPNNAALTDLIEKQVQYRIERGKLIGQALEALKVSNAYGKACEIAGHPRVGRPHFAQVLINEKYAPDMQSAFTRYLKRGKPAYVPSMWVNIPEAVEAIIQAGGRAVMAHPIKYGLTRTKLHALIIDFKEAGGVGLEVVSGHMTALQIHEMANLCSRFQLLASTGSDYHADGISYIAPGKQPLLPEQCIPVWHDWAIED